MTMKNLKLDRRFFLKGFGALGGAAVGLPLLGAMLDENGEALASGEGLPVRFVSWFWGNGVNLNRFEPTETGPNWQPSELLSPLSDIKDYLTVCTGLSNRSQDTITHHEGLCAFNGYTFIRRNDLPVSFATDHGGPTIDQLIAEHLKSEVNLPVHSLQMQISKGFSPADGGTTSKFLSVRGTPGNLTPLAPQVNPQVVWESLFGQSIAPASLRTSMLDYVKGDLNRLNAQVGVSDRQRIDAHLESIRELEKKVQGISACAAPGFPGEDNSETPDQEKLTLINDIMVELMVTAFECDLTRVASLLFLPIAGEATIAEINGNNTHHFNSHVVDGEEYDEGVRFIFDRMGDLMRSLRDRQEVTGGNLLDSSLIYASTDAAVGWHHGVARQPVLIGGHGRGYLKHPSIHYQAIAADDPNLPGCPSAGNISDVLLTCLQRFDPTATSVGEVNTPTQSMTPLSEILA